MATAISVRDLHKSYDGTPAVRGISFDVSVGEVFGLLGPNGAGKTTTVEVLEGYRPRDAGTVEVLGFDPQRAERELPGEDRRRPAAVGAVAEPDRPRGAPRLRRLLRALARRRRGDLDRRPGREGGRPGEDALRRTEAPPRSRRRPRRRPRAGLPGRADHGLRPIGAPQRLGDDPLAPRARQDDRADDALPRRGAAARRPRRRPPSRPDRDAGDAARADRRRADHADPLPLRRRGRRDRHGDADRGARRADGGRSPSGIELEGLEVRRPTLEDVYLELIGAHPDEAHEE